MATVHTVCQRSCLYVEVLVLRAHGATDAGPVRAVNEDFHQVEPALGMFLVADGMGGHNAGEVASRLASEAIRSFIVRTTEVDEFTWPFGVNPDFSYNANRLLTAVKLANRRVHRTSESHDEYTGMGTTVVAALIEEDLVTYVSVGDSRIYSFAGGCLEQLSQDDSWVTMLERERGVDPSALARHPMRHVLTNVLGAREEVDANVAERKLAPGDRLLLCSDGLHGVLDAETIAAILAENGDARTAAAALVAAALAGGATDNVTVVVVDHCPERQDQSVSPVERRQP
jgi:PPM family protein phosphatase